MRTMEEQIENNEILGLYLKCIYNSMKTLTSGQELLTQLRRKIDKFANMWRT
jgi:hypothetical protein